MKSQLNKAWLFPSIILFTAILARALFYIFEKDSPLFLYPIIDEKEFVNIAMHIKDNGLLYPYHFWHPPFYSYVMGIMMKIGFTLKGIVILQMMMGTLGSFYLYYGLKKHHQLTAFIVALIWTVYPLALFMESRFLSENLFIFLILLLFFIQTRPFKPLKKYILTGLVTSLLIITKSQFLIFFIIWILYLIFKEKEKTKELVVYTLISLLFPLLVILHNAAKTDGKLWNISSNGPVNLYIGNSGDLKESLNIRPYEWKNDFFPSLYDEAGIYFYENEDTNQNKHYPYLLSGYLIKKSLKENTQMDVLIPNVIQKTFITFHAHETPRNFDIYEYRRWNLILKAGLHQNPLYLPLALFYFAALLYVIFRWKSIFRNKTESFILLLTLALLIPSIIFFNAFRYRLAAIPFLLFFGAMFYKNYFLDTRKQVINLVLIIALGTPLSKKFLIQEIPKSESYQFYADAFLDKGFERRAEHFYDMAVKAAENEEKEQKALTKSMVNKGYLSDKAGDLESAYELYDQAVQANPESGLAYSNRGSIKYQMGDYQGALQDYDSAIQHRSKNQDEDAAAYFGRALTKIRLRQLEGAMKDFNQAVKIKPSYAKAYSNRGVLKGMMGNLNGAVKDLNKAVELDSTDAKTFNDRAIAYISLGQLDKALKDLERSISLAPNYPDPYFIRGMLQLDLGEQENACKDLNKAASLGSEKARAAIQQNCQ